MSVRLEFPEDGIGKLIVDRPHIRNALDWASMHKFNDVIEDAYSYPELRVLIVTGAQDAFIAGGDLKNLHTSTSAKDGTRLSRLMTSALTRLEALPCPTIAAINGPARGGGAEISLACDIRIMDVNADMGFVQIKLGLTPGWGAGQRLLHLVGYSRAFELLVTGNILNAEEAHRIGLINQLAAPGMALKDSIALSREISTRPFPTIRAMKRILRAGMTLPTETAAQLEGTEFPALWAADEHINAVNEFLNRKK